VSPAGGSALCMTGVLLSSEFLMQYTG